MKEEQLRLVCYLGKVKYSLLLGEEDFLIESLIDKRLISSFTKLGGKTVYYHLTSRGNFLYRRCINTLSAY